MWIRILTSIGVVYKDTKGRILGSLGEEFGDVQILVPEAVEIREALRTASDYKMDKISIENDLQIVINTIRGLMKVPSKIINHVIDIVNLAMKFNNIQFSYCNRFQNSLVDMIAKRSHITYSDVQLYQ